MTRNAHLSVHDTGPPAPCPAPFNLARYVLATGADDTAALVLVTEKGRAEWTYADLRHAVFGTAAGLRKAGLRRGDRLLLRIGNTVDFPILYLAAIAAGLVPVPSSAALTPREVAFILDHLSPAAVAVGAGITPPDTQAMILDADQIADLRRQTPMEPVATQPDDLAYIIYTSGTSGRPQAVCHAHRAVWARRMMWEGWYGLRPDDRMLHAGSFNWTYTLGTGLMDPWAIGATAIICPGAGAQDWGRLATDTNATIFAAAPGVFRQLLRHTQPGDFAHMRHGLCAGEALPAQLRARWEAATGKPLYEALGMSEVSTFISSSPNAPPRAGTSGKVQDGRRVAVLDAQGAPVPLNQPGTLAVARSDPGLMLGYLDAPEATAARLSGDWFVTGDTVAMDADGYVTYLGRDDDMLNAGGFRVSPLEIEEVLTSHPDISEAAALEIRPNPETSLLVAAYVAQKPLDADQLQAHCTRQLASYKCPRQFFHRTSLPKSPNGKLQRKRLREDLSRAET